MEKNNDTNLNQWVDDRLCTLQHDEQWQPNPIHGFARLREQLDGGLRRRRRLGWIAAGIAAVVVICLAFPATRTLAERYASACVSLWTNFTGSHGRLTFMNQQERKIAPDFALTDHSGAKVRLSDFSGKVVLLSLWDTECAACSVEIPWFIEFQQRYEDRDFVVLSIALDKDGWSSIRPYIQEKRFNHRVMAGNEDVANLYGDSVPTALIIDRAGRIAATHIGLCTKHEFETAIESTINEH
jgi:peroxiredoxin